MFPRCKVNVHIDDHDPVAIGYNSPKDALEAYVETTLKKSRFKQEYAVKEVSKNGVTLAFAVAQDDLFGDWGFVNASRNVRGRPEDEFLPVSTCIEGVAVEHSTPGFRGAGLLAVANAVGPSAPRTNVARSALEDTEEQRDMLKAVYALFADHVSTEISRLANSESYSLSRAVGVAPYIASGLVSPNVTPANMALLSEAMAKVPLVLVENKESRQSITLDELSMLDGFITVESPLYRSIEYFVKEAPGDVTANNLLKTLGNKSSGEARENVVCNINSSSYLEAHILQRFDIVSATALEGDRAIELKWQPVESKPRWFSANSVMDIVREEDGAFLGILMDARERLRQTRANFDIINVPTFSLSTLGLDDYGGFISRRELHLKSNIALTDYLLGINKLDDPLKYRELSVTFLLLDSLVANGWSWDIVNTEIIDRAMASTAFSQLRTYIGSREALIAALRSTPQREFDAFAWDRREGLGGQFGHF